jgi:hypothetical protein
MLLDALLAQAIEPIAGEAAQSSTSTHRCFLSLEWWQSPVIAAASNAWEGVRLCVAVASLKTPCSPAASKFVGVEE